MSASNIIVIALVIIVPFAILWFVDRHNKRKGSLFSGKATPTKRIIALVLGTGAGLLAYNEYQQSGRIQIIWIALIIIFAVYAAGFRGLMDFAQNNSKQEKRD